MTTLTDPNVHNIAVKGTFDNCQVKKFFILRTIIDGKDRSLKERDVWGTFRTW